MTTILYVVFHCRPVTSIFCWSGQGRGLAQSTITTPLSIGRAPAKLTCLSLNVECTDHGAFCNGFSAARAPPTSVRAHMHAQPPSMHVHRTHCSENCTVWPKPDQLDPLLRPCTPSVHLVHRNINQRHTYTWCIEVCDTLFCFSECSMYYIEHYIRYMVTSMAYEQNVYNNICSLVCHNIKRSGVPDMALYRYGTVSIWHCIDMAL